ncbi:histone-lysine N-methyltransferase SETMAR [Elysia marginata]|uniref:Histone-lysine N-methyltransferase SETMAR n=1 Tax=Elysia marginata TaxID=1093978 RepID=A0AAV4JU40_9GAST|nr:histone-lysine N-methyltransferase SETMAR [Elysia marginata]
MKISEISLKLEIPRSTVHEVVHDTLGYLKVSARWVPKMLTEDHKLQRVEISRRLLLLCQQDNGDEDTPHIGVGLGGDFQAKNKLFDNLITGDQTWVHLNTSETKRDSMTLKHPSSPLTKKFKVQRSKVMATVFWDAKGLILLDILRQGQCINAAQYSSTLDRLRDAIRSKIMRPLIQQTLHSNGCSATLENSPSSCPQSRPRTLRLSFVWTLEASFRRHGF